MTTDKIWLESVKIYSSYRVDQPTSQPASQSASQPASQTDGHSSNALKSHETNLVQRYLGSKITPSVRYTFFLYQMIYTPIPSAEGIKKIKTEIFFFAKIFKSS